MTGKRFLFNNQGQLQLVAFRSTEGTPVVFHPRNLLVGTLSETAWLALSQHLDQQPDNARAPSLDHRLEGEAALALAELQDWADSFSDEVMAEESTSYISSININVTQICNLKCVYCEAGGDGSYGRPEKRLQINKAIPLLEKLLDRVPNQESFVITFVGGEPLLYPEGLQAVVDFAKEYGQARGLKVRFRIVTNGTLLNQETLRPLLAAKMDMVISLNGPPALQDQISPTAGGRGSSHAIESGLQLLQGHRAELGSITLRAIFGKHNQDVARVYEYLRSWNLGVLELNFDVTCSDPKISEAFTQALTQLAWQIYRQSGEAELRQVRLFDSVFERLDRKLRVMNFCDSGKSFAVVDSSGNLFKCPWEVNSLPLRAGIEVSEQTLKALQSIEIPLVEHNNCSQCWARYLCGGGCMYAHGLATGAKQKPDPIYCKRTRALISEAILIYTLSREVAYEETH